MTLSANGAPAWIFISYRREDAAYPAAWLFDRLIGHYGRSEVFKDVDSIEPGDDFLDVIAAAVGSCDVLLALIGSRWLTVTGPDGQRRLDDPGDVVRLEIEAALARDVRVIPLLVDGARMPGVGELPGCMAALAHRHALELSPVRFDADTRRLLRALDRVIAETPEQGRRDAGRAVAAAGRAAARAGPRPGCRARPGCRGGPPDQAALHRHREEQRLAAQPVRRDQPAYPGQGRPDPR